MPEKKKDELLFLLSKENYKTEEVAEKEVDFLQFAFSLELLGLTLEKKDYQKATLIRLALHRVLVNLAKSEATYTKEKTFYYFSEETEDFLIQGLSDLSPTTKDFQLYLPEIIADL